jgi:hypothetical protein
MFAFANEFFMNRSFSDVKSKYLVKGIARHLSMIDLPNCQCLFVVSKRAF